MMALSSLARLGQKLPSPKDSRPRRPHPGSLETRPHFGTALKPAARTQLSAVNRYPIIRGWTGPSCASSRQAMSASTIQTCGTGSPASSGTGR